MSQFIVFDFAGLRTQWVQQSWSLTFIGSTQNKFLVKLYYLRDVDSDIVCFVHTTLQRKYRALGA